jgi:hypothetical protein
MFSPERAFWDCGYDFSKHLVKTSKSFNLEAPTAKTAQGWARLRLGKA